MQTPAEYRAQAGQCVRQAEHAKTSKRRLVLLQMAQTLVRMADEAEALNRAETDLDPIGHFNPGAPGLARSGAQRQLDRPSE